jgi:HD-like signal output (HDOD) protein
VLEKRRVRRISLCAAEQEVLGSNHAEVGGYLLGLWGLPPCLVEAVTLHHHPSASQDKAFTPLTAVHVADWLVHHEQEDLAQLGPGELDTAYLESLGLLHHVDTWRQCLNRPEAA